MVQLEYKENYCYKNLYYIISLFFNHILYNTFLRLQNIQRITKVSRRSKNCLENYILENIFYLTNFFYNPCTTKQNVTFDLKSNKTDVFSVR